MSSKSTSSGGAGSSGVRFRLSGSQNPITFSSANPSAAALTGPPVPPVVSNQSQGAQVAAPVLSSPQLHYQTASSQELRSRRQGELAALRVQLTNLQRRIQSQSEEEQIERQVSSVSLGTQTSPIVQPHRPIILPVGKTTQGNCTKSFKIVPPLGYYPGGRIPLDPRLRAHRPGLGRGGTGRGVLVGTGLTGPYPPPRAITLNRPPRFGGGQARLLVPSAAQLQAAAAEPGPPANVGVPTQYQFSSDSDTDTDWDI